MPEASGGGIPELVEHVLVERAAREQPRKRRTPQHARHVLDPFT